MEDYLISEYGMDEGKRLYDLQKSKLAELISKVKGKSKQQRKTLEKVILPRIALYKVLQNEEKYKENAEEILEKYLIQTSASKLHTQYMKFQKIPFFYSLFSKGMIYEVMSKDLWQADIKEKKKNTFEIDIKKCLWHDACIECGCPEICKYFCECDDIIYKGLSKMKFERKGTLGRGGDCCDFRYYKK